MSVTLTGREIKDLAEYAGFKIDESMGINDEELEVELEITECPKMGVVDECGDGRPKYYAHIARYAEYPEEGCMPLGEELKEG